MERYDEDLEENTFFQVLKSDYLDVFERAVLSGWIICIPRAGALPKYVLGQDDILGHILVPSEELPETHLRTLTDRDVVLNGNVLLLKNDVSNPHSVHILFDETFYDEGNRKYKVLCLEDPLYASHCLIPSGTSNLVTLTSFRDCFDLLWTEAGGEQTLSKLDSLIRIFPLKHPNLEQESLQTLRDWGSELFSEAIQVVLSDPRLREKTKEDLYLLDAVKLAVETYVLHGIYKSLMKGITSSTADEDSRLNQIIKNLSDLQVRDLDIDPDLSSSLTKAKFEFSNIDGFSTPLGKLACIKRAIGVVLTQRNIISSDLLLSILVFLVIKGNIPNWNAQISFLKLFRFSATGNESGENSYNISSIEAAIQHIDSESFLGSTSPEADCVMVPDCTSSPVLKSMEEALSYKGVDPTARFFECVRLGKAEDVQDILEGKYNPFGESTESEPSLAEADVQLCHPLCSCDKCERLMAKPKKNVLPTVFTRDERGYTGLHVSCIFGRPTVVEFLINMDSELNSTDFRGATPLHYAAQRGHQNALLLLLHAGADMNRCDSDSNTPLHLCSLNGHVGCVKALLFYAESVGCELKLNAQNNVLDTPLHLACRWGYSSIVELLLERYITLGLDLKVRNNRKLTPIECAHNFHITRMILDAKNKDDEQRLHGYIRVDMDGDRLSMHSTRTTSSYDFDSMPETSSVDGLSSKSTLEMKQVEKLLKSVALGDVKLVCFYLGIIEDPTPIQVASVPKVLCHPLCQCSKCVPSTQLVQEAAGSFQSTPINACNDDGIASLHLSVEHDHLHLTKVLLAQGADPNLQTRSKRLSPLHLAAQNSNLAIMETLLTNGAKVDLKDFCGNTALHYCSVRGFGQGVRLLLDWGACKNILNLSNNTPAQEAEERGHWHVVEIVFGKK